MPRYGYDKQSYYAGVDFFGKKYSGFGLSFSNDNFGPVLRRTQIDFSYALHFTIKNKIKIVHAYQISYFEYKYDRTKVGFGYNLNPSDAMSAFAQSSEIVPSQVKRNADFSSGLLVYGKRFYAGVTVLSITQPDEGLLGVSKRPLTQIYQGKFKFLNPDRFNVDVYGFIKIQKAVGFNGNGYYSNPIRENFIQYGTYLNYKLLSFHFAHRLNEVSDFDAVVAGIAINKKGFRIGYNSKCNYATHLSNYFFNELYLQYSFGRNKKETEDGTIKLID
ncbi:MAG: type IX secretion system membrane protein PorP/SprF [Sphingobacteriaceae bacterium]|nr:type IX secretion system membrane protein PorP/SprF [Sphingobacteriaceae bacterium]